MLTCPSCGVEAEVGANDEAYAVRGQWPGQKWRVRMCRRCMAGLVIRPRFIPPGIKAEVIPTHVWQKMSAEWAKAHPHER